jgi:small GTP-binding protein
MSTIPTREIVFFGTAGVGKTNIIRRLCGLSFVPTYCVTTEVIVSEFQIDTSSSFQAYDTPGQQILSKDYYLSLLPCNKDRIAIVVVFSNDYFISYRTAIDYIVRIRKENPSSRIIVCYNKCEIRRHRRIPTDSVIKQRLEIDELVELSSRNNTGFEKLINLLNQ